MMQRIADNLARLRERMESAARRAGRDPDSVRLVAVTKTQPIDVIRAAVACGLLDLGENRVQEALPKLDALVQAHVRWHLIGHLQRNKVKQVVGRFLLIHSVDSLRLAQELGRRAVEAGVVQRVLLEANVSGEASKYGYTPDGLRADLPALAAVEGIKIEGLMTMAPFEAKPDQTRPVFRALRALSEALAGRAGDTVAMGELSMGMTNDFEVAIEEGATLIRVGTAVFGERLPEAPD